MAKLPTAADVIGRVQPQSAPRINVPRDAFPDYSGITSDLTAQLDTFIFEQKKQNDETEAQDLSNQFNTKARTLTLGNNKDPNDPDYEPGYKSLLGKNAMDRRADYEKRLEDFRKELIGKASNDTVRRRLRTTFDRRTAQFQTATGQHFNAQRKTYRKTTFEATNAEATESAIADPQDPSHIDDVYNNTFKYYSDQGVGAKAAQSLAEEARSKANASVILALSETDPQAAKEYMNEQAQAGRIDLDVLAETRKKVDTAITRFDSIRITNETLAKFPDTAQALKYVRKTFKDPKLQDAVVTRIKGRLREQELLIKTRGERDFRQATNAITAGEKTFADVDTTSMSTTQINRLKKIQKNINSDQAGYANTDDPDTMLKIAELKSNTRQFRNYELSEVKDKLTEKTFLKFKNDQAKVRAAVGKKLEQGPKFTYGNSKASNTATLLGKGPSDIKRLKAILQLDVQEYIQDYFYDEKTLGQTPSPEMIDRHIAKQTLTVDPSGFFKTDRLRVEAERENLTFVIDDPEDRDVQAQISEATGYRPEVVARIISALGKAKRPITIDTITATFERARRNALNNQVDD